MNNSSSVLYTLSSCIEEYLGSIYLDNNKPLPRNFILLFLPHQPFEICTYISIDFKWFLFSHIGNVYTIHEHKLIMQSSYSKNTGDVLYEHKITHEKKYTIPLILEYFMNLSYVGCIEDLYTDDMDAIEVITNIIIPNSHSLQEHKNYEYVNI